ncbi:28S ribosomal protein S18b, mitochondrial-like isoform X2 [Gigantopelta aegis]|uniref:28S ribosomal protein S18b, mitochondrial-like isoform X2 n=1 Tax=Gigantopelta aegis TaxID=1735272 RepID=UPI001B88D31A|nr:28S ribosomal protein S18b, mitochondrial-like isoform X2 [Gigantopelta aegis]
MSVSNVTSCVACVFKRVLFSGQPLKFSRAISRASVRLSDTEESEETKAVPEKPPRIEVDAPTSKRYLDSKAYAEAYGDQPIWIHYRRNFKGQLAPRTRKTCIRAGVMSTGNPCPICRDEYLVIDHTNTKLLEQFVSPHTGEVFNPHQTGLCQKQHKKLLDEILKARHHGLIEDIVPFREYDYSEYLDSSTKKSFS